MTIAKGLQRIVYEFKALPEAVRALLIGVATYGAIALISISRADDWHTVVSALVTGVGTFVGTFIFGKLTGNPTPPPPDLPPRG